MQKKKDLPAALAHIIPASALLSVNHSRSPADICRLDSGRQADFVTFLAGPEIAARNE